MVKLRVTRCSRARSSGPVCLHSVGNTQKIAAKRIHDQMNEPNEQQFYYSLLWVWASDFNLFLQLTLQRPRVPLICFSLSLPRVYDSGLTVIGLADYLLWYLAFWIVITFAADKIKADTISAQVSISNNATCTLGVRANMGILHPLCRDDLF